MSREAGWEHISAGRFDEAEVMFRELLARTDPQDAERLWFLFGLLGDILNSLNRTNEAAEMMRRALAQAERLGPSRTELHYSRYRLGNHALNFASPSDALRELDPIPEGAGHIHCLMHSVAARALWKLDRREEARVTAKRAIDAAPTDERRADLMAELEIILKAG